MRDHVRDHNLECRANLILVPSTNVLMEKFRKGMWNDVRTLVGDTLGSVGQKAIYVTRKNCMAALIENVMKMSGLESLLTKIKR